MEYTHVDYDSSTDRKVSDDDLEAFCLAASEVFHNADRYDLRPTSIRTWWARIASWDPETKNFHSVFCFVDLRNGDVLYPDGWSGPVRKASGVRGNIYSEDLGITPYGARMLRA